MADVEGTVEPKADLAVFGVLKLRAARFQVFTAVKIEFVFFLIIAPCSVVVEYQRFGGSCCLHLQG
jgi:hypothetical protein